MARFIVSHRLAGKSAKDAGNSEVRRAIAVLAHGLHAKGAPPASDSGTGRQVAFVDGDNEQLKELQAQRPGNLLIEPVRHRGHEPIRLGLARPPRAPTLPAKEDGTRATRDAATAPHALDVTVQGAGKGVARASVTMVLQPPTVLSKTTDSKGTCRFHFDGSTLAPDSLSTAPIRGYWTVATTSPQQPATLELPTIQLNGPLAWWHEALGVDRYEEGRGAGIRIGIIDTGVGPNACLTHVKRVGSILNGHFDEDGGDDVDHHGTEIAGLVAARPTAPSEIAGVSPGAEVFSIRVFPPDGGSNQADVAAAIDRLVDQCQVDLINLSLTGTEASELEHDAIIHADERGTLCLCAAGNDAGTICFPAAFPECVSVSALGKVGWGPPGSIASQMVPASPEDLGRDGLFLAPFSSRGQGLGCCAPGLGLLSTFPAENSGESAWGEDSGTSLSTPLAVAALAAVLSASPEYRAAPRDKTRTALARRLLAETCRSVGLGTDLQGMGIPVLTR